MISMIVLLLYTDSNSLGVLVMLNINPIRFSSWICSKINVKFLNTVFLISKYSHFVVQKVFNRATYVYVLTYLSLVSSASNYVTLINSCRLMRLATTPFNCQMQVSCIPFFVLLAFESVTVCNKK